jgi:hypothetical protein
MKTVSEGWDVTQWYLVCLQCVRFWVQSPASKKRKDLYNENHKTLLKEI